MCFLGAVTWNSVEESITITTSWPELHNIHAWSFNYKGKPDVCNCCYLLYIQNLFSWIWKQLNRGILYSWAQAFCHHLLVQKPLIVGFEVVLIILSIWWEFKACWSYDVQPQFIGEGFIDEEGFKQMDKWILRVKQWPLWNLLLIFS